LDDRSPPTVPGELVSAEPFAIAAAGEADLGAADGTRIRRDPTLSVHPDDRVVEAACDLGCLEAHPELRLEADRDPVRSWHDLHRRDLLVLVGRKAAAPLLALGERAEQRILLATDLGQLDRHSRRLLDHPIAVLWTTLSPRTRGANDSLGSRAS